MTWPGDELELSAEQRAGEAANAARDARRVRRTPPITLSILIVLVLAMGVTAAVDLRRLDTVGGAATSWTEAVTFGDCERYRLLSSPLPEVDDRRSDAEVCEVLRAATADNRLDTTRVDVRLVSAAESTAVVEVETPAGATQATLSLVRTDRWRVVLDAAACDPLGCP